MAMISISAEAVAELIADLVSAEKQLEALRAGYELHPVEPARAKVYERALARLLAGSRE